MMIRCGSSTPSPGRLHEQPFGVGVTAEVEDRHAGDMPADYLIDLGEGDIGPDLQLAQVPVLDSPQDRLQLPRFLRQVAQVAPTLLLVGEGEERYRLRSVLVAAHGASLSSNCSLSTTRPASA